MIGEKSRCGYCHLNLSLTSLVETTVVLLDIIKKYFPGAENIEIRM